MSLLGMLAGGDELFPKLLLEGESKGAFHGAQVCGDGVRKSLPARS